MLRKLVVVLSILLILVAIAVPCMAYGSGDIYYFTALQFDSLTNSDGSYAWQGNCFAFNSSMVNLDCGNYYMIGGCFKNSAGAFVSQWDIYTEQRFTLYSAAQLIDAAALRTFTVGFGDDLEIGGTIDFSFNVDVMIKRNNRWVLKSYPLSGFFIVPSGTEEVYNLGDELLREIQRVYTGDLIMISNLTLTFNIDTDGGLEDPPCIAFSSRSTPDFNQYYAAWLDSFSMESLVEYTVIDEDGDLNPVGWLGSVLDGVWSFPVVPGFTLGDLGLILLGIGILFVFLKLFGGG